MSGRGRGSGLKQLAQSGPPEPPHPTQLWGRKRLRKASSTRPSLSDVTDSFRSVTKRPGTGLPAYRTTQWPDGLTA